jgi:hypothetical protein
MKFTKQEYAVLHLLYSMSKHVVIQDRQGTYFCGQQRRMGVGKG